MFPNFAYSLIVSLNFIQNLTINERPAFLIDIHQSPYYFPIIFARLQSQLMLSFIRELLSFYDYVNSILRRKISFQSLKKIVFCIDPLCQGYWQPYEPNDDLEGDRAVSSNMDGRWRLAHASDRMPFVCRTPACPEGETNLTDFQDRKN